MTTLIFLCIWVFRRIDKLAMELGAKTKADIYDYLGQVLSCSKQMLINEVTKISISKQEESIKSLEQHLYKLIMEAMPNCENDYKMECRRVDEFRIANKGSDQTMKNPRRKFIWNESIV